MALHTELPIYRKGVQLLDLAIKVQVQLPRSVKRILGEKITQHCVDMLDLMALANASQRAERAVHIEQLLTRQRAVQVLLRVSHDSRFISPKLWAESIELLGSIGKQAGGWLWGLTYRIQMRYLELAPRRPLGLPFDGETFNDPDATACADRLEWLRAQGYRVPQFAIDRLREEAMETP